jgi:hypothetical protein
MERIFCGSTKDNTPKKIFKISKLIKENLEKFPNFFTIFAQIQGIFKKSSKLIQYK